jgi:two-component system, response regulator RegA
MQYVHIELLSIMMHNHTMTEEEVARAEWEHINRVLSDCRGNISVAAKRLNVHRRTLQRKLLKFPPYI